MTILEDRYHVLEKLKQHFPGGEAASTLFSGALVLEEVVFPARDAPDAPARLEANGSRPLRTTARR